MKSIEAIYRNPLPGESGDPYSLSMPSTIPLSEISSWETVPIMPEEMRSLSNIEKMRIMPLLLDRLFIVPVELIRLTDSVLRMIHQSYQTPSKSSVLMVRGEPGIGKNTATNTLIHHLPGVIFHHGSPNIPDSFIGLQIPFLYTSTVPGASISGLKENILRSLQAAVTESRIRPFSSLPFKYDLNEISLLKSFGVSLLIIKCLHLGKQGSKIRALLDQLEYYCEEGISVLLILSEEQAQLLTSSSSDGIILNSEPSITFQRLKNDHIGRHFIKKLWNTLSVDAPELSSTLTQYILQNCFGNRSIIINVIKEVQLRTLSLDKSAFTADELRDVITDVTADLVSLFGKESME